MYGHFTFCWLEPMVRRAALSNSQCPYEPRTARPPGPNGLPGCLPRPLRQFDSLQKVQTGAKCAAGSADLADYLGGIRAGEAYAKDSKAGGLESSSHPKAVRPAKRVCP